MRRPASDQKAGRRGVHQNRGSIGVYACDIARALGASRRLFVDPDSHRCAIADSYAAESAESIDAIHHGFDIAVESTGWVDALACARRSLAPEGICESAGNHFKPGERRRSTSRGEAILGGPVVDPLKIPRRLRLGR